MNDFYNEVNYAIDKVSGRFVDHNGGKSYLRRRYQNERTAEIELLESGQCNYNPNVFPLVDIDRVTLPIIGNRLYQRNGSLYDKNMEMVTNCTIEVEKVLHEVDTGRQLVRFRVMVKDTESVVMTLPVAEFREGRWLKELFGIQVQDGVSVRAYLESKCDDKLVKHIDSYKVPGWYINEKTKSVDYVTADGDIASDMDELEVREEGANLLRSELPEIEVAGRFMNHMSLTKDLTAFTVMMYSVLANLFSLFKLAGCRPRFLLALVGPKAKGKTQLAMLLSQLVGRKPAMTAPFTFSTTELKLEESFDNYKDSVMLIDDLMPTTSKRVRENNEQLLERLSRIFGDGTPRLRSSQYCEAHLPKGLAIITAEYIKCCESSMSRQLRLAIGDNTVNRELIGAFYKELDILPAFLWNLDKYVIQNQDDVITFIQRSVEELNLIYAKEYERLGMHMACLETAFGVMKKYLIGIGMDEELLANLQLNFHNFLIEIVWKNIAEMQAVSPVQLVINTLHEHYEKCAFVHVNEERCATAYRDDSFIYFKRVWLLKLVREYASTRGIECPIVDENGLKSCLKDNDILVPTNEGDAKKFSVRLPGSDKIGDRKRYYRINIDAIANADDCNS